MDIGFTICTTFKFSDFVLGSILSAPNYYNIVCVHVSVSEIVL